MGENNEKVVLSISWTIDDVKKFFPEGTTDEAIQEGLMAIEDSFKEVVTYSGLSALNDLSENMLNTVEEYEEDCYAGA